MYNVVISHRWNFKLYQVSSKSYQSFVKYRTDKKQNQSSCFALNCDFDNQPTLVNNVLFSWLLIISNISKSSSHSRDIWRERSAKRDRQPDKRANNNAKNILSQHFMLGINISNSQNNVSSIRRWI